MVPDDPRSSVAAEPPPRVIVPLSDSECRALLERHRLCIVSLVDGQEPYAVPVFYGLDGDTLYLGVAEGRKTRVLDANPRVYIVVTEVGPGDAWRSVAVTGVARSLMDPAERQQAIDVLVSHNRRVRTLQESPAVSPRRRSGGRVLRIDAPRLSGRAFG